MIRLNNDVKDAAYAKLNMKHLDSGWIVIFEGKSGTDAQRLNSKRVMSTIEWLCLLLDNTNREIQRLKVKGCRRLIWSELSSELERLKELYVQMLDIWRKDEQAEVS